MVEKMLIQQITATILRIDKDGFHVDGNYVVRNGRISELSSFYIGSAEGNKLK